MGEDLASASEQRSWLHSVAASLTDFIEVARDAEVYPPETADYIGEDHPYADHPNLPAYLHNLGVSDVLEAILPFRWSDDAGPMPRPYGVIRDELSAVLEHWGCGNAIDEGQGAMRLFRGADEPARTLTAAEENRLSRALRSLEWFVFCLPRREDRPEKVAERAESIDETTTYINSLLDPIFFRTRRYLDASGAASFGESLAELKASPGAWEAYQTHTFRGAFHVGQSDRHPDKGRLLEILSRAKAYLVAAETCLPIEGDDERSERPFGWEWRTAEYYVCEACSALCDVMDGEDGELGGSSVAFARGWNTEINFGLRCLDSQVDNLLARWKVQDWEHRLAHDSREPSHPVTIKAEEVAGLRRTVETIESGIANAGIEQAEPTPGAERNKTRRNAMLGKRGQIIAVYHDHKDWTYTQIAEATGADRGHVCRVLKPLRDRERGEFKAAMPRGSKGRDGTFNAW